MLLRWLLIDAVVTSTWCTWDTLKHANIQLVLRGCESLTVTWISLWKWLSYSYWRGRNKLQLPIVRLLATAALRMETMHFFYLYESCGEYLNFWNNFSTPAFLNHEKKKLKKRPRQQSLVYLFYLSGCWAVLLRAPPAGLEHFCWHLGFASLLDLQLFCWLGFVFFFLFFLSI